MNRLSDTIVSAIIRCSQMGSADVIIAVSRSLLSREWSARPARSASRSCCSNIDMNRTYHCIVGMLSMLRNYCKHLRDFGNLLKPAVLIIFIRFALSHIARMLPVRYQSNVASSYHSNVRAYRQLYRQIITTITAALLLQTAPQTVLQTHVDCLD